MKKAVARILRQLAEFSDESWAELKRKWYAVPTGRRAAELARLKAELENLQDSGTPTFTEVSIGNATLADRQRFQEQVDEQSRRAASSQEGSNQD